MNCEGQQTIFIEVDVQYVGNLELDARAHNGGARCQEWTCSTQSLAGKRASNSGWGHDRDRANGK
jgi:hypothetical protein